MTCAATSAGSMPSLKLASGNGAARRVSRGRRRAERFAFAARPGALRKPDARLHGARAEHGHTHRAAGQLPRERLRERDDRVLRRRVDAVVLTRDQTQVRAGVDQMTLLLLDQDRDERPDAVHDAPEVHVEQPAEGVARLLPELQAEAGLAGSPVGVRGDAGVVADEVDRPERLEPSSRSRSTAAASLT